MIPVIWLVGVAHLGTPEYYGGLQKRLDAQTSVLFEGVGADQLTKGAKLDTDSGLQSQLARALGLVFQLDAIDYQRPNFHNSDLSPERLNDAIARRATPKHAAKPDRKLGNSQDPTPSDSADTANTGDSPKVDNETYFRNDRQFGF